MYPERKALRTKTKSVRVRVANKLAEQCGMKLGNTVPLSVIPIIEKALEININIIDIDNTPEEGQTIDDLREVLLFASGMKYEKKYFLLVIHPRC